MDKILVTRSSMPPFEEYVEEIRDIWDSRWLTNMGTKHQQLAASLRAYFQVENVSLFCNGHQALEAALAQFPRAVRSSPHRLPMARPRWPLRGQG